MLVLVGLELRTGAVWKRKSQVAFLRCQRTYVFWLIIVLQLTSVVFAVIGFAMEWSE